MQTQIVAAEQGIEPAVQLLRTGEIVALPTETVYGLAADARNPEAVAKIFEAKERPRFDPLIVHLPTPESLEAVASVDSDLVRTLAAKFWPGPLTIVLPKTEAIPDIVTAGLRTVAVRMSAHCVFQQIARAFGGPLAAPSANRFGRLSPTTASHVYQELAGRVPLIVDAGPTLHGIESTIIGVGGDAIEILREGPITAEMLAEFAPVERSATTRNVIAPGQLPTHYAPRTKLLLVDCLEKFFPSVEKRIGALSFRAAAVAAGRGRSSISDKPRPTTALTDFAVVRCLSERGDLREAAANLFRMLRELDAENLDLIVAEKVPDVGVGVAINERLKRGSG